MSSYNMKKKVKKTVKKGDRSDTSSCIRDWRLTIWSLLSSVNPNIFCHTSINIFQTRHPLCCWPRDWGNHVLSSLRRQSCWTQVSCETENIWLKSWRKLFCRYVLRDDHPYCIKCYENVFANNCDECGKIIGIDSKDLSYKEKHWHEACFLCNKCRTSLVDKQFGSKVREEFDYWSRFHCINLPGWSHLLRTLLRCTVRDSVWWMWWCVQGRDEEDGVQDKTVAREVLRLLHLQESHRHQEFYPQGARYLLCQVLRGEVCHQVHQVQQGEWWGW